MRLPASSRRLKYRSETAIRLEILGALMMEPRLRTNLAQIVNVNLARLDTFLDQFVSANLVKKDKVEGHDVLSITAEGRDFWEALSKLERKLNPEGTKQLDRPWN
jgi:predicted transcriptional regulator